MRGSSYVVMALACALGLGLMPAPGALAARVPTAQAAPVPRNEPPPCVPDVSSAGSDVVLTFDDTVPGGCTWTVPSWVSSVRVLVVAGGGGGGYAWGGSGGGAGGMQGVLSYSVVPGQSLAVTVGVGGAGGTGHDDTTGARSGGNSTFDLIVSAGGGAGTDSRNPCAGAKSGGSGGGGGGWNLRGLGDPRYCAPGQGAPKSWPGAIDDTQGSRGSDYQVYGGGSGGGGAGGQPTGQARQGHGGLDPAAPEGEGWNGGAGRASTITGASALYAGGGGGGGGWRSAFEGPGDGGSGGGGQGGHVCCGGPDYAATAGVDGLGGGGGGGSGARAGARGGSGVVIVRFSKSMQSIAMAANPNPVLVTRQATLSASGYSGTGAITYEVVSGGDKCSVSGATLNALAVGTCEVRAQIAADHNYLAATSDPITVTVLSRYAQTITAVATPSSVTVPGTVALSATGFLGTGAITYAIASGSVCALSGTTLTVSSPGSCQVVAQIAQDDTHAAATSTPVTVTGTAPPPPPAPPLPPGIPTPVEALPGPREVTVRWQPPTDPGSSPVSAYWVFAAPGGERVCAVSPRGTSWQECTVKSLAPGQRYEFWVQAVNAVGPSPNSARAGAVPLGPPGPPRPSVHVVDEVLSVIWEPPVNNGGLPVTSYRVEQRSPGGEWDEISYTLGTGRSALVTGLRNGAPYEFRVIAWNSAGEGTPSEPVTGSVTLTPVPVTLPGTVPTQSFTALGSLPGEAELRLLRTTPQSGYVCTVMKSPTVSPGEVWGQVPNVVAFLGPGSCTLQIWKSSESVVASVVGTVRTTVARDADFSPGVLPMDVIRLVYPADSQSTRLPRHQQDILEDWVASYRQPFGPWGRPRQVYSDPFVFCPAIAFHPAGGLHDQTTTRDPAVLRAWQRCTLDVGSPIRQIRGYGIGIVPGIPGTNASVFEAAMLPVHLPPAPPRNVTVRPGTFDATISWDPPATSARTPVTGYAAWIRPKGEDRWTRVSVDPTKRTARVSFEDRAWKDVPVSTDIDVRVAATNDAGYGAPTTTDFRLDYRLPEFTELPETVPPQSWVPLFERRGIPEPSLTTRGPGCTITRGRFLIFIGPGKCEVSYRIDDHKGDYIRWLADLKVTVEEGAPRAPGIRELDMVNITFADKEARPDARSRDILNDLIGPDIEAVHMYTMVPGNVPRALTEQRVNAVRNALKDWNERYLYTSRSPIQQSGLPEGNGNLMRIGYIRRR